MAASPHNHKATVAALQEHTWQSAELLIDGYEQPLAGQSGICSAAADTPYLFALNPFLPRGVKCVYMARSPSGDVPSESRAQLQWE